MPWLEKIAAKSFVQLVKSITPDDFIEQPNG
jgi:hypothetical protein